LQVVRRRSRQLRPGQAAAARARRRQHLVLIKWGVWCCSYAEGGVGVCSDVGRLEK
jgi:hypothetical protein